MMRMPISFDLAATAADLLDVQRKWLLGLQRINAIEEEALEIATAPKEEVWRRDMVRLYRYRAEAPAEGAVRTPPIPVLIAYALVGRYQMIDLEAERSFVRKLVARGLTVYLVDWGEPQRQHRWVGIDDYVSGYIDGCVDVMREREGVDAVNLLGICQGGVMALCHAALFPEKVRNLIVAVTPIDFHGDAADPQVASGYMNRWARSLQGSDIDELVDASGLTEGSSIGRSFMMMNPFANLGKYASGLLDVVDDEHKLLNFLRMERWLSDRPDVPGEFVRQWFKDLYQDNKLVRNELVLGGRTVDLRRITMPVLNVMADGDVVIPNACSRGHGHLFGTTDYTELAVPGGHIGAFVGGKAQKMLAPGIADWLEARQPGATPAAAGAAPVLDPDFDPHRLADWMRQHLPEVDGEPLVERFAGGQSNPTYRLTSGRQRQVLRRKPSGPILPSAHAIDREYRVMRALEGSAVPVPKVHLLCEDASVIGTPFYLMEYVEGRTFWDPTLPGLAPAERAAIYDDMNRVLAALHGIDPAARGLADFGRTGAYLRRQIERWTKQYRASQVEGVEPIEAMERLIEWLPAHLPASDETALVHGDFRIDNLIFHRTEPRIVALLDWELSTLGHPLADLAYHVMTWRVTADEFRGMKGEDLGALGIPSEAEYVAAYARRTGRESIPDWDYYLVFNMFRMAAILQGILARGLQGSAAGADALETGRKARPMAEAGWRLAQQASLPPPAET